MTPKTSAVAVCCSKASRVLGDEPRILHRDDRLRREILQQRDLLIGERTNFLTIDRDIPEQRISLRSGDRLARSASSSIAQRARRPDRPMEIARA